MYCRNCTGTVSLVLCGEVYYTESLLGRVHYQRFHCILWYCLNLLLIFQMNSAHVHRFHFQIVDPRVPKKGFKYYGAQVKCPTDEVFKLKKKAPRNSFLVNFFDARRTWYVHTYVHMCVVCCRMVLIYVRMYICTYVRMLLRFS